MTCIVGFARAMAGTRTRLTCAMGPLSLGLLAALPSLVLSQDRAPVTRERPFNVLKYQNVVLTVSILSILLLIMIIMVICVYKPIRRR